MGLFDGKKFDLQSTVGKIQGKIADIAQFSENSVSQNNSIQQGKEVFCSNCGTKLNAGAKFCHGCGASVGEAQERIDNQTIPNIPQTTKQSNHSERQQEYVGTMLKCPNCGAAITQTTAICPDCGYRITGQTALSSVQAFYNQYLSIENMRRKDGLTGFIISHVSDKEILNKKLILIKNYPIPNSIDDISEFMLLAFSNIDVAKSKKSVWNTNDDDDRTISDAWISKLQQAYQKAQIAFPNDSAFSTVQHMYFDKMKELKIKVN